MTMIGFVIHTHTRAQTYIHVYTYTRTHTLKHTRRQTQRQSRTHFLLLLFVCCCCSGPYQNTALQLNEYLLAFNMTDCMLQCVAEILSRENTVSMRMCMVWQKAMLTSKCVSKDCFIASPCFAVKLLSFTSLSTGINNNH